MATIKKFEDLEIWLNARKLVRSIYQLTSSLKFSKDFGLKDQIQRAGVSIMSNCAEGFERGGNKEFLQFLWIEKASIAEVRSLAYVASDLNYIGNNDLQNLQLRTESLSRQLSAFIAYLKTSDFEDRKKR